MELSIVSRRYVIGIKIQILFLQEDQLFTDCMIHGEVQGKGKEQRWRKKCGKTSIVAKNIFECCIQLFSKVVAGFINHYDFPTETPILSDYQKCCFHQIIKAIFHFFEILFLINYYYIISIYTQHRTQDLWKICQSWEIAILTIILRVLLLLESLTMMNWWR